MKKVIAIVSLVSLISCGGSGSAEQTKQDTVVVTDTLGVVDSLNVDSSSVLSGGGGSGEVKPGDLPIK